MCPGALRKGAAKCKRVGIVVGEEEKAGKKTGKIVFNIKGCEDLITQLVGFGVEKHDDLVDALTCAIIMADQVDHTPAKPSVVFGHAPSWFRGGSGGGFGGGSGASMERGSDGSWNFR